MIDLTIYIKNYLLTEPLQNLIFILTLVHTFSLCVQNYFLDAYLGHEYSICSMYASKTK